MTIKKDKIKHFIICALVSFLIGAISGSLFAGAFMGMFLGVGKELWDVFYMQRNMIGTLTGFGICYFLLLIF